MNRMKKRLSTTFCPHPVDPVQNGSSPSPPNDRTEARETKSVPLPETLWTNPNHRLALPQVICWAKKVSYKLRHKNGALTTGQLHPAPDLESDFRTGFTR